MPVTLKVYPLILTVLGMETDVADLLLAPVTDTVPDFALDFVTLYFSFPTVYFFPLAGTFGF